MIVRINEIDIARAEALSGWEADPRRGPLVYNWPADAHAYEVLVLDHDEAQLALDENFRHEQLRQLILETTAAIAREGEQIVYRFDGALAEGELLAAIDHLAEFGDLGRYAIADFAKFDLGPAEVIGSIRLQLPAPQVSTIVSDARVGLERSVRLRAISVPEEVVGPVLETVACDDDAWQQLLPRAGFVLGTTRGLKSLHVMTRQFDAPTIKSRLMRRLLEAAQGVA